MFICIRIRSYQLHQHKISDKELLHSRSIIWIWIVITIQPCLHSWLISLLVTKQTRRLPLVGQELLILPQHLSSPWFMWRSCYSIFSFCVDHCRFVIFLLSNVLSCPSIYGFWWPFFVLFKLFVSFMH